MHIFLKIRMYRFLAVMMIFLFSKFIQHFKLVMFTLNIKYPYFDGLIIFSRMYLLTYKIKVCYASND